MAFGQFQGHFRAEYNDEQNDGKIKKMSKMMSKNDEQMKHPWNITLRPLLNDFRTLYFQTPSESPLNGL